MKYLFAALSLSIFIYPIFLHAKGLQLSKEALDKEVGEIDRILQSTHEQK